MTGDSRLVAQHVATLVGMRADRVLTGQQLDELHDEALWRVAEQTDLFADVDPNQKEWFYRGVGMTLSKGVL